MTKARRLSAKQILKKAIEALPEKTNLTYIDYRDNLDNEQMAKVLGGHSDDIVDAMDFDDYEAIRELLKEGVPEEEEREKLIGSDQHFHQFMDECRDRDESTPYADLLKNTRRKMVRFMVPGSDGNFNYEMECDSWRWDAAKTEAEAKKLAGAAKIDFETNRNALIDIVQNATYGGSLCVLGYVESKELADAVEHLLRDEEKHRVRITFTDPQLLILDRMNGSGHDEGVKGTIVFEFGHKDLGTRDGVMQLDHRGAGTGYSWSDDIAAVVYTYYKSDPKIELLGGQPEAK